MDLDSLVDEFAKIEGAEVDRGINHPSDPSQEDPEGIWQYLASHPYLKLDPTYLEFLLTYGGAGIYVDLEDSRNEYLRAYIAGFGTIGPDLREGDSTEPQMFDFALCDTRLPIGRKPTLVCSVFAFSIEDDMNIYEKTFHGNQDFRRMQWEPFVPTFLDWFKIFVKQRGRITGQTRPIRKKR